MARLFLRSLALAGLISTTVPAGAERDTGYRIDWSSLDAGGELISIDAVSGYEVGGSIGQPEAGQSDGSNALTGAGYALYGGYWSVVLGDDRLFADGFESP